MFLKFRVVILTLFFFCLIFLSSFYIYKMNPRNYIIARFYEAGPLHANMPVYYKGCQVGKTEKAKLSEDYKYAMVKIIIYDNDLELPEYIIAKVKESTQKQKYIGLINTDPSAETLLKMGSVIRGEPLFDTEEFLFDLASSNLVIPLLKNFSDMTVSINKANNEIGSFFSDSRIILKNNKNNLEHAIKDVALTAKSLKDITSKFNNTITENTTLNINKSSTNILEATENIKNITEDIDRTVAKIDCTVSEVNIIASNIKAITRGFCEVFSKRFAGLKFIFGKPVN